MKYLAILFFLFLTACGDIFVPDIIEVEDVLNNDIKSLVETVISEEMCDKVESKGYPCDIDKQMHVLRLEWIRAPGIGTAIHYRIKFCIKEDCPLEIKK